MLSLLPLLHHQTCSQPIVWIKSHVESIVDQIPLARFSYQSFNQFFSLQNCTKERSGSSMCAEDMLEYNTWERHECSISLYTDSRLTASEQYRVLCECSRKDIQHHAIWNGYNGNQQTFQVPCQYLLGQSACWCQVASLLPFLKQSPFFEQTLWLCLLPQVYKALAKLLLSKSISGKKCTSFRNPQFLGSKMLHLPPAQLMSHNKFSQYFLQMPLCCLSARLLFNYQDARANALEKRGIWVATGPEVLSQHQIPWQPHFLWQWYSSLRPSWLPSILGGASQSSQVAGCPLSPVVNHRPWESS